MGLFDWFSKKKDAPANSFEASNGLPIKYGSIANDSRSAEEEERLLNELMSSAEQKSPLQDLIYFYQHIALPEMTFMNHPELIKELATGPIQPNLCLLHVRAIAHTQLELNNKIPVDDEAFEDSESDYFEEIRVKAIQRNGLTAHIVIMPKPTICPECYMAAIVLKDSEPHVYMEPSPSTRYFTLEKSVFDTLPIFCEWTRDKTHLNFGEGPEPTVEKFADAVFKRIQSH